MLGNGSQLAPEPITEEEKPMSQAMQGYWSRHAASGDPNGAGAFAWPAYDAAGDQNLVLDLELSTQSGLQSDLCDFWDTVVFQL